MNVNILDIITTCIILGCVIICAVKGLLLSLFNMLSLFISFLLTRQLYPHISNLLRQTPLFGALKGIVGNWIGPLQADTGQMVTDAINNLSIPDMFKRVVLENMDLSQTLDLGAVHDYVSGYAAGLAIDALSVLLVFIAVFMLMRIIAVLLRLVSRMPVVKTFNRVGGAVMGLVIGALLSWLTLSVMRGLFSANTDFPVADMIAESVVARFFLFRAL